MLNQASGRCVRSRNQGMIREAGDRGREAVSGCYSPGATATCLSCGRALRSHRATLIYGRVQRLTVFLEREPKLWHPSST